MKRVSRFSIAPGVVGCAALLAPFAAPAATSATPLMLGQAQPAPPGGTKGGALGPGAGGATGGASGTGAGGTTGGVLGPGAGGLGPAAGGTTGGALGPVPAAPRAPAVVLSPAQRQAVAGAPPAGQHIREIEQVVRAWRLAWELGDASTYLRFYDPAFKGDAASRQAWEAQRRARLGKRQIAVKVENLRTRLTGEREAEVQFVQRYSADGRQDVGEKRLKLHRVGGAWLILQESWRPLR